MALNLITNPNTPPTSNPDDWNNFVAREDLTNRSAGIATDTISLTKWDASTDVPEIAQGSIIEVGGSLYQADSDTALVDDAGLADGEVHIKLVPGTGVVVPTLTSDALPTWDATKSGFYDSDDKFLPIKMTRSGAVTKIYSEKKRFPYQNMTYSFSSVGDLDIDGNVGCVDIIASGGVSTGGNSTLKFKTFTGTLTSTGDISVAHGEGTAVLSAIGFRTTTVGGSEYLIEDGLKYNNTNVFFNSSFASGVSYKIVVTYT